MKKLAKKMRKRGIETLFAGLALMSDYTRRQRKARSLSVIHRGVPYIQDGDPAHTLDIYRPRDAGGPLPVLVYIHGGGFTMCSKDTHRAIALAYSHYGKMAVFNVNYRLAPRHRYPAATEDVAAAYAWVVENAARYGGDPSRIVVGGESAGGNLTLALGVMASYERPETFARRVFDLFRPPLALLVLCGLLQVSDPDRFLKEKAAEIPGRRLSMHQGIARDVSKAYLGQGFESPDPERILADPLLILESGARPDRPFPDVFTMVGDKDILISDTRRLEAALARLGLPCEARYYNGVGHAFQTLFWKSQALDFWRDNFRFLYRLFPRA